jgi:hypothetical protein
MIPRSRRREDYRRVMTNSLHVKDEFANPFWEQIVDTLKSNNPQPQAEQKPLPPEMAAVALSGLGIGMTIE